MPECRLLRKSVLQYLIPNLCLTILGTQIQVRTSPSTNDLETKTNINNHVNSRDPTKYQSCVLQKNQQENKSDFELLVVLPPARLVSRVPAKCQNTQPECQHGSARLAKGHVLSIRGAPNWVRELPDLMAIVRGRSNFGPSRCPRCSHGIQSIPESPKRIFQSVTMEIPGLPH